MTYILTRSGAHFDYLAPDPDAISIVDIAFGLAREHRFAGQTLGPYTVAQHSLAVVELVTPEHALEALLHDAAEAYCKDIPHPLKQLLPDYRQIERRVDSAIRAKFGLPPDMSPEVKHADLVALATERRDLMPYDPTPWPILDGIEPNKRRIRAEVTDASMFALAFLTRFQALTGSKINFPGQYSIIQDCCGAFHGEAHRAGCDQITPEIHR